LSANTKKTTWDHNTAWQDHAVARTYDHRRFSSWSGRLFNNLEQRALSRMLDLAEKAQPVTKVLDAACGTGRISSLLCARGYDLTSTDISDDMLAVARERLKAAAEQVVLKKADIYNLPFPADHFDCVTCIRLFQHLTPDERASALSELGRVTKRHVIVNVTYHSPYFGALRRLRQWVGRYAPRYTCSEAELRAATQAAGLTAVKRIFPQPLYNANLIVLFEKR
jgi:ubiquinone/menaquinone biosynthesis C-methylase UbiE